MSGDFSGDAAEALGRDLRDLLGEEAELPPPIVVAMDTRIDAWERGRKLVASFPAKAEYAGPTGFVQGGVLAAAFDNAFGPVAYTAAEGLVVSTGLELSFIRPLRAGEGRFTVTVELVEATRRLVFVRAEAHDDGGRLIATCTSELIRVEE